VVGGGSRGALGGRGGSRSGGGGGLDAEVADAMLTARQALALCVRSSGRLQQVQRVLLHRALTERSLIEP
jgi:hypothetical protein